LLQIFNNFVLRQASISSDFLVQSPSIAELIKEVEVINGLENLDEANDMR
jgi:hypothetical protein